MVNYKYKYTKEELSDAVQKSVSYAETLRRLGIPTRGNNAETLKHKIEQWGIDTSHFTGHSKVNNKSKRKLEDYLNNIVSIQSSKLYNILIKEGIKREKCEFCGISNIWNGKLLRMQLHHIDGNSKNNNLENIKVVCPNCHSQTTNYKNKKIANGKKEEYRCVVCGRKLKTNCATKMCLYCSCKNKRKVNRPPYEELLTDVQTLGYRGTGRKHGVSDNAIRKWIKSYQNKLL